MVEISGPPRVSVVIPTRRRLGLLKEAVESVRSQAFESWELIVVDDASRDGTREWLAGLDDPRIRTISLPEHSERVMARNAGLQLARAPAVMFLDDDDRLRPHALECLHAALGAEPSVVASVGARHRFRPGGPGVRINHPTRPMVRGVLPELLLGWSTISGQNLFRTEQVRTVGGYRDRPPAEDRRLLLNLAVRGPFALVPEVVHDYRVHDAQTPLPARSPLRERVFWDFVVRSSGRRRLRWIRLWRAGRIWRWAEWRRERGQGTIALVGYASAALLAPALLGSPILRPLFLWQVRDALRSALSRPATSDRGR